MIKDPSRISTLAMLRRLALSTFVLLTVMGIACTGSESVPIQSPAPETHTAEPIPTPTPTPTPTPARILPPTLKAEPTVGVGPTSIAEPTGIPTSTATGDSEQAQGIFGTVLMVPGVCRPDPEDLGACLNTAFPGQGSFDIRVLADTPDVGYTNPIVAKLESEDDGLFRVRLAPGQYSVWMGRSCEATAEVVPGVWSERTLRVYLS